MRSKGRAQSVFHLMVRQRVLAHLSWWPTISDVFDFASRPDGARLRNLRVIIGFELSTGSHPIFSFEGVLGIVLIVGSVLQSPCTPAIAECSCRVSTRS